MARKILSTSPPPEDSRSPLHISSYSLPSGSRIPKVMIAVVAGFVLTTAIIYYTCKWVFRKKCPDATDATAAGASAPPPQPDSLEELQARVTKSLAQRLGSKIATAIPTVSYAELAEFRARGDPSGGAAAAEAEACAVCLTDFSKNPAGTKIKILPKCAHAFHCSCIDLWLMTHASCPICRASLFVALADLNAWASRGGASSSPTPPPPPPIEHPPLPPERRPEDQGGV